MAELYESLGEIASNSSDFTAESTSSALDAIAENDDYWSLDPEVELAFLVTTLIGLIILSKVINAVIRFRLGNRAIAANTQLSPEQEEIRQQNMQRRIDAALEATDHDCPICLAPAAFPVLTDCGHIFCCTCIVGYWQHSKSIVTPCDCAICRSTFHMLLPIRWPTRREENTPEANLEIQNNNLKLDDYNRRFSNNRPMMDYIRDVPILIPYLLRSFFHNDLFTVVSQIRIAFVFIAVATYLVLPIDMIPESIYGLLGFLDDCIIAMLVIGALFRWFRNHMADRGHPEL